MANPVLSAAKSRFTAAFAVIALTVLVVQYTDWMALWNAKLLDVGFSFWRKLGPEPAQKDVVVVGIDVDDLREFKDPINFWHPHYGRLLSAMAQAKPAVVGLDIVFPERSYQNL